MTEGVISSYVIQQYDSWRPFSLGPVLDPKELVMCHPPTPQPPPSLCICWPKQGGGDRSGRRDQPLSQSFWPLCSSHSRTGGRCRWGVRACGFGVCAHTHVKERHTEDSRRALILSGGKRQGVGGEAERGPRGGSRLGWAGVHGDKGPLPPLAWRGGNLKGRSVSRQQTGVRRAGRGSICGGQWPRWSTLGAPRYPVIHDNQSRGWGVETVGDGVREGWRESEREREHGKAQLRSESARLESVAKNKAASDFHFFTLCPLYIVRRRVPLFSSTGNKGAFGETCVHVHTHTGGTQCTLVWLIELCLYSKSNGLFSPWHRVPLQRALSRGGRTKMVHS